MKTRSIWLGLTVLTLFVAAVIFFVMRPSDSSLAQLETVLIEKGDLILSIPATGVIEPRFSVEIKSKASGEISKTLVEEGDAVEKGEVIIEIDPRIEEIAVRRAKADLMAAAASVKKAEIFFKKAGLAWSRKEKLHKKGLISQVEAEEDMHEIALREADLLLARAQLLRAEESLSETKERLKETKVRSPLSGVILTLDVQPGQLISSGTSSFSQGTLLAVIGDLSRLRVRAEVDETDARKVGVGQEAFVRLDAFPDQSYRAHIVRVSPRARIKNDLAVIELLLSLEDLSVRNPSHDVIPLWPGLSADVEVITQRLVGVPLVDGSAVRQVEGRWGVSVLQGETVSFHEVTLGATDGERMQIQSDLPVGTQVVLGQITSKAFPSRAGGSP